MERVDPPRCFYCGEVLDVSDVLLDAYLFMELGQCSTIWCLDCGPEFEVEFIPEDS